MNENAHHVGDLLFSRNEGYGIITNLRTHGVTVYWYKSGKYSADTYHWVESFKACLKSKLEECS